MKTMSLTKLLLTAGGVLLTFWLGNRATEAARSEFVAGADVTQILPSIPAHILGDPWHVSTEGIDTIGGAVLAGILALILLYRVGAAKNTRPGEEHGSASWATARDIAPLAGRDPKRRLSLTHTESLSMDTRRTQRNLNVLVIGASGTGKTRSYINPNIAAIDASMAITDAKGEIYRETADTKRAQGFRVECFNLVDLHLSARMNPMKYFSPESPEVSVAQLAECIMLNTSGDQKRGSDQFWERAERALLTALIAFVWATTPNRGDAGPNLIRVTELQKGMSASEGKDAEGFRSETDLKFEAARAIVEEWKANPDPDDDEVVFKTLDFACRQYRSYEQGAGETKKSVIISLGVRLAPLDMTDVQRILSGDDIQLDRVGFERTALYLQMPDSHATFKFIAAMFWQTLFEHSIYAADHEANGQLPIHVHAFLDEFANIGKIPSFPILISTIRSRNISASVVVQNYSQGKAMWGDDWAAIVANCDSKLFLGGDETETTKWLSNLIGNETVETQETSQSYGMNGSSSRSTRRHQRPLITPDEIGRLSNSHAILIIRGLRPFRSRKLRAFQAVRHRNRPSAKLRV